MREEQIELDPVVVVARITTLEMLVRQLMVVQLRLLAERGHIELTPAYVQSLANAYTEKVDQSTIIDSNSADVNYAFKANVLHQLERFFDEIAAHIKAYP
ncbi:MAG: hypothetical protein NZM40_04180 [Sphingomonadaceae bacterium]|uniref:hypothetical protein n=1 Tax=Thermaurantiacus sp. TaxID=2820283 RepID=UPI00298EDB88|nr:hypothetical protein [Thermaurantiacus sp.]MCS6986623.1 hypothetical protein [Sphingomonadaceae bacterium]MDW8414116.1 hypothetical protein [Thermaurantiacus sp.]